MKNTPTNNLNLPACSLVEAYSNLTYIYADSSVGTCINVAANGDPDSDSLSYCECCENSRLYSATINTCPNTNLDPILDLSTFISSTTARAPWKDGFDCSPILNSDQCTQEFGFVLSAGTEFFDPVNLPAGVPGTEPSSDVRTLTTFPAEQTFTLTISRAGYTSTITMVEAGASNAGTATATESSSQASGTSQATGVSGSGSGSGSSSASSSAGARAKEYHLSARYWSACSRSNFCDLQRISPCSLDICEYIQRLYTASRRCGPNNRHIRDPPSLENALKTYEVRRTEGCS